MSEIDPFRILALAIHPRWSGVVYAGTSESGLDRVFGSIDAGRTWFEMSGATPTPVHALAVDSAASDTIYLGGPDGVFARGAGEEGWSWAGLTESTDALAVDARGTIYAAGRSGVSWTKRDREKNWIEWHGPPEEVEAIAVDAQVVFAGGGSEIFRTSDGGGTWTRCAALPLEESRDAYDWGWLGGLAFDPTTPGAVYAAGGGGLFRTVDDGRTWTKVHPEPAWSIGTHAARRRRSTSAGAASARARTRAAPGRASTRASVCSEPRW